MSFIRQRLKALGAELPGANTTMFSYRPAIRHENRIHVAGQIPKLSPEVLVCSGALGRDISSEQAARCVKACVLNALAWIDELTRHDGARVTQVLRVNYFFQVVPPNPLSLSELADVGSELLAEVFGPAGAHPRSVIGVAELPRNSPVLVDMDVAVAPGAVA